MNNENSINKMIDLIINHCKSWQIKDDEGNCLIVDPIDNKVIGEHYALSHYASALCIYGRINSKEHIEKNGIDIINGLLKRWEFDAKSIEFHYDFNNFALCVLIDFWEKNQIQLQLCNRIKQHIMNVSDSNHYTINWLPMRMYVNKCRYRWSNNSSYLKKYNIQKKLILKAINSDGYIEDRLPFGKSYNLQYNIATLSLMVYLNKESKEFDIGLPLYALKKAIDPDNDINYIGRGCNQIFGWGPWIYLLKTTDETELLELANNYLAKRLPTTLINDNIFLNSYPGADKSFWWDYHYSSVYISHLLFWLTLAEAEKDIVEFSNNIKNKKDSSGVIIYKGEKYFINVFNGRSEYLAEKGPSITNLWTKEASFIFKGGLGPWQGMFGNKYVTEGLILRNYIGPISNTSKKTGSSIEHIFPDIDVDINDEFISIIFKLKKQRKCFFNIPIFKSCRLNINKIKVMTEDGLMKLNACGTIKNQYEEMNLYQSNTIVTKSWRLIIPL